MEMNFSLLNIIKKMLHWLWKLVEKFKWATLTIVEIKKLI